MTGDRKPKLSVVMPVRNGEAFLRAAAESVLGQTLTDWEMLVVDDGSTDATASILESMSAQDGRLRILRSSGQGIVSALNIGIAQARGEFVARMDADDIALPSRLQRQAEVLEARPELVALGTAVLRIDRDGRTIGEMLMPVEDEAIRRKLASGPPIVHPTAMIRRSALLAAGSYRRCCFLAEDYDLWIRLARIGQLGNLPEPLLLLRSHADQISVTRRLLQRASAALARRLAAADAPAERDGPRDEDALLATLKTYADGLQDRPEPIEQGEWKDAEPILRALRSQGAIPLVQSLRPLARAPVGSRRRIAIMAKLLLAR